MSGHTRDRRTSSFPSAKWFWCLNQIRPRVQCCHNRNWTFNEKKHTVATGLGFAETFILAVFCFSAQPSITKSPVFFLLNFTRWHLFLLTEIWDKWYENWCSSHVTFGPFIASRQGRIYGVCTTMSVLICFLSTEIRPHRLHKWHLRVESKNTQFSTVGLHDSDGTQWKFF